MKKIIAGIFLTIMCVITIYYLISHAYIYGWWYPIVFIGVIICAIEMLEWAKKQLF